MPRTGRIFTTSAQIYVTLHYEIFVGSRFSFCPCCVLGIAISCVTCLQLAIKIYSHIRQFAESWRDCFTILATGFGFACNKLFFAIFFAILWRSTANIYGI